MTRAVALTLALLAAACATAPAVTAPPAATSAATSGDDFAIESTILAVYNVISGPAGRRDWDRFEALFAPGARLIATRMKNGALDTVVMTPKEYADHAKPYFDQHGFFERPVNNRIDRFADIAHVFSTYESRNASADEKPFARGINSFQLVRSGDTWKVLTIFWQEEDAAHPIPATYLPR